jgi:hypothetical protein
MKKILVLLLVVLGLNFSYGQICSAYSFDLGGFFFVKQPQMINTTFKDVSSTLPQWGMSYGWNYMLVLKGFSYGIANYSSFLNGYSYRKVDNVKIKNAFSNWDYFLGHSLLVKDKFAIIANFGLGNYKYGLIFKNKSGESVDFGQVKVPENSKVTFEYSSWVVTPSIYFDFSISKYFGFVLALQYFYPFTGNKNYQGFMIHIGFANMRLIPKGQQVKKLSPAPKQ